MNGDLMIALLLLALAYCLGGLHGLLMAWSQPARMRRYATRVERIADRIVDLQLQVEVEKSEKAGRGLTS